MMRYKTIICPILDVCSRRTSTLGRDGNHGMTSELTAQSCSFTGPSFTGKHVDSITRFFITTGSLKGNSVTRMNVLNQKYCSSEMKNKHHKELNIKISVGHNYHTASCLRQPHSCSQHCRRTQGSHAHTGRCLLVLNCMERIPACRPQSCLQSDHEHNHMYTCGSILDIHQ